MLIVCYKDYCDANHDDAFVFIYTGRLLAISTNPRVENAQCVCTYMYAAYVKAYSFCPL